MSMSAAEKLTMVKSILRISDTSEDSLIGTYLDIAKREIISWRYSYADPAKVPTDVPVDYEMTQVMAVVAGYTQSGVENQVLSVENGIHRHFRHTDMIDYIRANVIPIACVPRTAVSTS